MQIEGIATGYWGKKPCFVQLAKVAGKQSRKLPAASVGRNIQIRVRCWLFLCKPKILPHRGWLGLGEHLKSVRQGWLRGSWGDPGPQGQVIM